MKEGRYDDNHRFTGIEFDETDPANGALRILRADVEVLRLEPTGGRANGYTITGLAVTEADTVDGSHASAFATAGHNHSGTYCRWRGALAAPPASPIGGDIYYDTVVPAFCCYDGTTWRQM
jgi:hypothetical protein